MSANPYALLGVPKTATKDVIQKAFRRRVKGKHPDQGGDRKEFELLHLAYQTLMDDERRARYDATGELEASRADNKLSRVVGTASAVFQGALMAILERGAKPTQKDVLADMRKLLDKEKAELKNQRSGLEKIAECIRSLKGRFTTDDAENLMESLLDGQLAQVAQQINGIAGRLELVDETLAFLKRFRFRADAAEHMQRWTSNAATSAAASWTFKVS